MRELREIYKEIGWEQHKLDLLFDRKRVAEEDIQGCFTRLRELMEEASEHYNFTSKVDE